MNYTNVHNNSDLFDIFPGCYQIRVLSRPVNWHDMSILYEEIYTLYHTVKDLDSELYSIKDQLFDIKNKLYSYLVPQ